MPTGDIQRVGTGALARAAQIVTVGGSIAADGTPTGGATFLPPGRAAATASVPVVLSNEDKAVLDKTRGVYTNVVLYSGATTAGDAVLLIATVAGTATITMSGGGSVVVPVPVGALILPFAATNAVQTTGTLTAYKLTL